MSGSWISPISSQSRVDLARTTGSEDNRRREIKADGKTLERKRYGRKVELAADDGRRSAVAVERAADFDRRRCDRALTAAWLDFGGPIEGQLDAGCRGWRNGGTTSLGGDGDGPKMCERINSIWNRNRTSNSLQRELQSKDFMADVRQSPLEVLKVIPLSRLRHSKTAENRINGKLVYRQRKCNCGTMWKNWKQKWKRINST